MHLLFVPISILLTILTATVGLDGDAISDYDGEIASEDRKREGVPRSSETPIVFRGISADIQSLCRVCEIALLPETPLEQVGFRLQDADSTRELPHSLPVAHGLLRYLAAPPPTGSLNCISFIERILDLKAPLFTWMQTSGVEWGEDLAEEQIRLGDIVLLFSPDDPKHLHHVAVKFAENLYLSKAHPDFAPILLADLELMKAAWKADQILVISSRALT